MRIVIRTDASAVIGSGHFMRCLSLADALAAEGHRADFVSRDLPDGLAALAGERGHRVLSLPAGGGPVAGAPAETAWPDEVQVADAGRTLAAAGGRAELIVVDHYGLGVAWEQAAREGADRLMAIDDIGRHHNADILLDQNFYRDPDTRYPGLKRGSLCLIGPRYALLRPDFAAARRPAAARGDEVRRVVVFVGGMDAGNMTGHVLEACADALKGRDIALDVIIGQAHPRRDAIAAACAAQEGWTLHVQVQNMAQMLARADLAIGAGGTNTWERMTVGTPALALRIAENQRALLDECAAAGLLCVPDDRALTDVCTLSQQIGALINNARLRAFMSAGGLQLVDGRGTARVARQIAGAGLISMRRARQDDIWMLLDWRNHPGVRAVSRNKDVIDRDNHKTWFDRLLAADDRWLLVGERDGEPIGTVRFDARGQHAAEVSISLAPAMLGAGLGGSLLAAAEDWLSTHIPRIRTLHADVLAGNTASNHLFERGGYTLDSVHYSKGLDA